MVPQAPISLDGIHPAVIAAVRENAERQALLVLGPLLLLDLKLKEAGFSLGVGGLPAGFMLDLAAICQLAVWENAGLREYLPPDLPTPEQAKAELLRRATTAPGSFQGRSC